MKNNINKDEMYCVSCDKILKTSELMDHQLSNHHIDNVKYFVHQMRKIKLKERKEKIIKLNEEEGSRG